MIIFFNSILNIFLIFEMEALWYLCCVLGKVQLGEELVYGLSNVIDNAGRLETGQAQDGQAQLHRFAHILVLHSKFSLPHRRPNRPAKHTLLINTTDL